MMWFLSYFFFLDCIHQMATTPSALGTVPARIPMHGTDSYQTSAAAQQPPVQVCSMTSSNPDYIHLLHTYFRK